jgi:hypothetical protein
MPHRSPIHLLLVSFAPFAVGCGGRVDGIDVRPDSSPPASTCAASDCPDSSPPGSPPSSRIDPATAAPEAGVPDDGEMRPEGPCPPPETVLGGTPCDAGPQICPGNPGQCGSEVFYDALVCANVAGPGTWLWQTVAGTVCADPGVPDAVAPVVPPDASPPSLDPATPVHDMGACVPWSSVLGQPFVADAVDASSGAGVTLGAVTMEMVGSYVGHATSPWGEWDLLITFAADGHYVASAYNGGALGSMPPPFYYGATTGCESLDHWRLLSNIGGGGATGQIDVPFSYGAEGCGLPGWQGLVSLLSFGSGSDRLLFQFATSDGYGPIVYDLWRRC